MTPVCTISISIPGGEPMQVQLDSVPRILVPLKTRRIGYTRWITSAPYVWHDGANVRMLPAGYEWDGASVPAFAHWYCEPGSYLEASGPHDHAYQFHWLLTWRSWSIGWVAQTVSKSEADAQWKLILEHVSGVRLSKARLLWDAVRFGGWLSWLRNTCNNKCDQCPCNAGGWCPYVGKSLKPEPPVKGN